MKNAGADCAVPASLALMDLIPIETCQSPHASGRLTLTLLLACNTPDEAIAANVTANAAREEVPWLRFREAHDRVAVLVGGGPSAADHLEDIAQFWTGGADLFALNAASGWLRDAGIFADYQCIIDARPENIGLLDVEAPAHILASQVDPSLVDAVREPILMHLMTDGVEDYLPTARRERGDYALVGGGHGVGNSVLCAAYVMGYRTMHCFGFDSSHRDGKGHAYAQPLNDDIPCVATDLDGATYISSAPMKAHAERFLTIAGDLRQMGCTIAVHGSGLLPAMFNRRAENA